MSRTHTPIEIDDVGFMVAASIDRCPKTMMLRELVTNAVESAALAPEGRRRVVIRPASVGGMPGRKLQIFNTGPGMTGDELLSICNLAASRKTKGLDANFGIGAKVASLPSNPAGMCYWSCRDGVVSQVILGKTDGTYSIIHVALDDPDAEPEPMVEVTDAAIAEGYEVDFDWTEVTLYGTDDDQDTVSDPYGGNPRVERQWIATYLYERFDALPEGVEITLAEGTHTRDGRRTFKPFLSRIAESGTVETVVDERSGIRVHYAYDPPSGASGRVGSISGSITSARIGCAVIHKREIYEVRSGRRWASSAPAFGVTFGSAYLSTLVELPDDHPVAPEQYRQFLTYREGDQRRVEVDDFDGLVARLTPGWFRDVVNGFRPKSSVSTDDIRKVMQDLMDRRKLKVEAARDARGPVRAEEGDAGTGAGASATSEPRPAADRDPPADEDGGTGDGASRRPPAARRGPLIKAPAGSRSARDSLVSDEAPQIYPLRDEGEIEEKGIVGKAALYVPVRNELFLNMRYGAFEEAIEALKVRYATAQDPDALANLSQRWGERIVIAKIAIALVNAQSKRNSRGWSTADMKTAMSPEALSIAADGYEDMLGEAGRVIGRQLNVNNSRRGPRRGDEEDAPVGYIDGMLDFEDAA